MSTFMAATRKAAEPQAGSSRRRMGRTSNSSAWQRVASRFSSRSEMVAKRRRDSGRPRRFERRVEAVEDELEDGALGEVAGDLGPGVVGAERLLVDVFLEDVAKDIGIDFVVFAAGRIVEVPGVAIEEARTGSRRRRRGS